MKRMNIALIALVPLLAVTLARAQTVVQGTGVTSGWIKTTAHNFSTYDWADKEICKPCHTPHNGQRPDISSRFWAHDLPTNAYQMSYVNDGTSGMNTAPKTGTLDGKSLLCMGCHDGTIALDAFVGKTGGKGSVGAMMTGTANLGTDLSNDHPVGNDATFTNVSGTTLNTGSVTNASSSWNVALWSSSRGTYQLGNALYLVNTSTSGSDPAGPFVVGCGTCHNPHGSSNATKTAAVPHLLRMDNTASNLCLTCHKK